MLRNLYKMTDGDSDPERLSQGSIKANRNSHEHTFGLSANMLMIMAIYLN
jgi:hypothetical protein